jgi:hypothetical protein
MRKYFKIAIFILLFLLILSTGLIIAAPYYLTYEEQPFKADAIVLFLGPDFQLRMKEARRLAADGYADYVIIPAYRKIYKISKNEKLVIADTQNTQPNAPQARPHKTFPRHYEDTHIELVNAKTMLDASGFKSTLLVSSPYHTKRIKIISEKVLDKKKYRVACVPSRYEVSAQNGLFSNSINIRRALREYLKILWFVIYINFD